MKALLHPVTLASLVVLVVNDHVLKWCWPGLITGKLSDIAGMILAPIVLGAFVELATRRRLPWTCTIAVGVAFALAKTWAPATHAYEVVFATIRFAQRVVLVRDPTDLVALPFGAIAAAIMASSSSEPRPGSRLRPDSG